LPPVVIAASITAFHVVGALLVLWALLLSALGVMRHDFPPKGAERPIIAISALLVAGAIGTAIATGGESKPKGSQEAGAKNTAGSEGSAPPAAGTGTPAPGTGANNGQSTGSGKKPAPTAAAQTLTLSANPTGALSFDKKTLTAQGGVVRIVMHNPAPVPHNIALEGAGGVHEQGPTVSQNGDSQIQGNLKPGTYTFFCSVPGHRQAGMQGTLTVK
jgi:plastocyanin